MAPEVAERNDPRRRALSTRCGTEFQAKRFRVGTQAARGRGRRRGGAIGTDPPAIDDWAAGSCLHHDDFGEIVDATRADCAPFNGRVNATSARSGKPRRGCRCVREPRASRDSWTECPSLPLERDERLSHMHALVVSKQGTGAIPFRWRQGDDVQLRQLVNDLRFGGIRFKSDGAVTVITSTFVYTVDADILGLPVSQLRRNSYPDVLVIVQGRFTTPGLSASIREPVNGGGTPLPTVVLTAEPDGVYRYGLFIIDRGYGAYSRIFTNDLPSIMQLVP